MLFKFKNIDDDVWIHIIFVFDVPWKFTFLMLDFVLFVPLAGVFFSFAAFRPLTTS